jgi:glyoxylase-like metal-dependent hydrolase (beta-lactamase superfamily II)
MIKRTMLLAVVLAALVVMPCRAESVAGLPLHVKTLAPGVVRAWVGDYVSSTAVTAIATKKGIVVVDTTNIPKLDRAFRAIFARELGRSDFKYLINTHGHVDHVSGNGVYADCEIVAHESVKAMMEENFRNTPRLCRWNDESLKEQEERLAAGKVKEEEKAAAAEQLAYESLVGEYLKSSPKPTFPTISFRDKLVLDCGDVTLELYQAGGTHTQSDIFILVPQKGLLFTGDMMADKWLSASPGCLALFGFHSGQAADYPVLVKNWQAVLERKDEIKQYIPGHWNGELSFEGFKARFEYAKAMLAEVEAKVEAGSSYDQIAAGFALKDKFPQLVGSPGFTNPGHQGSLKYLYQAFSGKKWLLAVLQEPIMNDRFAAEFPALKADILKNRETYFFSEADLIGLGYFLLQQMKKADDAVLLFELNAELYPGSWNAFDSLAEAWYEKGEKQKALTLYKKSMELNPGNENGKKFIERIEKELKK